MLQGHSAQAQNGGMLDLTTVSSFLAVADAGSTLAAGRLLGVSQTTVARRVAALEQALGLTLFEHRQAGYALTSAGAALIEPARSIDAAARTFAAAAASEARAIHGTVRLTTEDIYAVALLAPLLRDLHVAYPHIRLELDTTEEVRDLSAGDADIALRTSDAPSGAGLVGRRVADDAWTVYCSKGYAAAHGVPDTIEALRAHAFIAGGAGGVWPAYSAWLKRHALEGAVIMHDPSLAGLLADVRAGAGLALLPALVADRDPDLIRCLPITRKVRRGMWLLTHERVRHEPRVRVVLDFLADRLAEVRRQSFAERQGPASDT